MAKFIDELIAAGGLEVSDELPLSNYENYGVYGNNAHGEATTIHTSEITKETWLNHYHSILNLLRDGIETDDIQSSFIEVIFMDNNKLDLTIPDYLLNLIMWNMLIQTDTPIESKHVFFAKEIKKDTIKDYIDTFLIDKNRKRFSNKDLNNIIDDTLHYLHDIDEFAMFLANTVNLEDNVFLMEKNPAFYQCMHADLSSVPIEDVKSVGMQYANKAIDIMKDSKKYIGYDHCLADACRASEGINPKQFKEFTINIGTKPNGRGGVFEKSIANSFINGGVAAPLDYFIESSTGRTAQIIKYKNVGSSGHFARLLGLNNMDSHLHPDPNYDCHTRNYLRIFIKDAKTLKMLKNRYYKLSNNGIEQIITKNSTDLIGKTILLRSPITCASNARGQGICYKCYGDLAYTVFDAGINFGVNIGRIASENLSSSLTQKLLSAKHLLETFVEKITWVDKFSELFEIEGNIIRVNSDIDEKNYKLFIDPNNIELENEEDDDLSLIVEEDEDAAPIFNEYITEFEVLEGETLFRIANDKNIKLYISSELNSIIRRKGEPVEGKICIDFTELKDVETLFIIPIENNELSKTLNRLEDLLNTNNAIKGMDIHQLLQSIIETTIEGGLNIASSHLEVIISNQCRDAEDILKRPKWYLYDPDYTILSLNKALTCNPSVVISMSYQKVGKLLYNPLTFKKNGSSFMDLFFMEKPQYAIKGIEEKKEEFKPAPGEYYEPIIYSEDPDKVTVAPEEIIDYDNEEEE